jgi:hypothetical protein
VSKNNYFNPMGVFDKEVKPIFENEAQLRDYFAAAALTGLLASGHYTFLTDREDPMVAECYYDDLKKIKKVAPIDAYQVADAMLAARKEGA